MRPRHLFAAVLGAFFLSTSAHAWQVYTQVGLPTLGVGVAHPLSETVVLRGDFGSTGSVNERRTEEGIDYDATGRLSRFALLADWHPGGGAFRITGGAHFNDSSIDLVAVPAGSTITLGGQTFPVTAGDRFDASIDFPGVTPYIGIGWGSPSREPGWHLTADLGVSIGRASLSAQVSGQLAGLPGIDEAVDRELAELRDGVGKVRAIPQLTIGIGYRF